MRLGLTLRTTHSAISSGSTANLPCWTGALQPEQLEILGLFPLFFQAVRYWEDEDSGHWEEARKIEASSIVWWSRR